jgi:hypothetical protein
LNDGTVASVRLFPAEQKLPDSKRRDLLTAQDIVI